ncbi:MAG: Spi family protease inhibitor [Porphyromonadaceae bacterium]|nr:Spi family protease inhibitor [Porphyromonadaceae bacterium]
MKTREKLSRWLLISLFVGLMWTSCAKEEIAVLDVPTASSKQVMQTQDAPSLFLTEEEAEVQASDLYAAFFADELRSSHPPRVENVRLLDPFRSTQDSSGGIYVVNFENNGGYIMMAEHRHGEPILAACPQGNFDLDKALGNPNFAPILANMRALVAAGPQQGSLDGKSLPPDVPMPEPGDPHYPDAPIIPKPPVDPTPSKLIRKLIGYDYGPWNEAQGILG